ncbi:hypothetical protein BCR34DRAFT_338818 [Clohesyomyces aquaticus]|uniref:F-box domain-containing protein n=1 Tax=Clohesyomyces aquaticus TaxID=1231657 RepID=A0A1Y1ZKV5_9PLEO|nr:hypothetical protein BCR34DRAFT_338818 [Clohesyomyces aquaticus]
MPSLLELPAELLYNIMGHVKNKKSLRKLCQVSQLLGNIAQQSLFTFISIKATSWDVNHLRTPCHLTRTVLLRPDLASQVKHLCLSIPEYKPQPLKIPDDESSHLAIARSDNLFRVRVDMDLLSRQPTPSGIRWKVGSRRRITTGKKRLSASLSSC